MQVEKRPLARKDLAKYESIPIYYYTERDSLNRITVLKEAGKESYLVAGRYTGVDDKARLYIPLSEEERGEIEKLLKLRSRDASISFL